VGDLNLAGAYFVPSHSSFAKKNDRRMIELQDEVRLSLLKEHVLVLTDANGWIGESPSTIEDGEEERTVFARTSEKPKPNPQGRWFLMNMNSSNLLILNGLKSKAQSTFVHISREASSVVD